MKISFNWLKEYCDISLPAAKVAEMLTACGLEVESTEPYESIKGGLRGVVVGEVKTKIKHPNADKLSLTTVDIGSEPLLNIVCGAPNVEAGQKVLVAVVGAMLYPTSGEPFEIKKSKIRGEASEGMICAEDEIGLGKSHEGVLVLDPSAKPGTPASEYFKLAEDIIFEIGLTPNRVDASSHIGVARDLLAVINSQHPSDERKSVLYHSVADFKVDSNKLKIEVIIEDPVACPRYSGITISGVTVKESPGWLKERLRSIGAKPINNIVDITNFVLHECGQPLHAFDADEIKGKQVRIKKWNAGTKFVTLDGVERTLSADDLMISNAEEGMCLAGVFGGAKSGVKEQTKNIFIESAYFSPPGIRRTSKHHGLKTDAAFRYERGADPEITIYALKRAAMLVKEICGGEISSEIIDVYPKPVAPFSFSFSFPRFEKLAGVHLEKALVKTILSSLGIKVTSEKGEGWTLEVPCYKPDVQREADVTEELLRIYGYDKIPLSTKLRAPVLTSQKPDKEKLRNTVSDYLSSNGFFEIITNSLTKEMGVENSVRLSNPLSEDLAVMRQSLLYKGLEVIAYNKNRKQHDLKLYEFGKTFHRKANEANTKAAAGDFFETQRLALFLAGKKDPESWNSGDEPVDFFFLKSFVENCLKRVGIALETLSFKESGDDLFSESMSVSSSGSQLLVFGKIKNAVLKKYDVNMEVYFADINWDSVLHVLKKENLVFKEITKFPEVRRDLSMVLGKNVRYADLEKLAHETERKLLRSVNLFDVFEGEKIGQDKKSYALSFALQDETRTLTDKEVDKVMEKLSSAFESKLGAMIRKSA